MTREEIVDVLNSKVHTLWRQAKEIAKIKREYLNDHLNDNDKTADDFSC